jgi:hypothetical protein
MRELEDPCSDAYEVISFPTVVFFFCLFLCGLVGRENVASETKDRLKVKVSG